MFLMGVFVKLSAIGQHTEYLSSIEIHSLDKSQYLGSKLSFISNKYQDALQYNEIDHSITYKSAFDNFRTTLDSIFNEAFTKQVIIINEAHYNPIHRFFLLKHLEKFKKNCFNIFFLEDYNENHCTETISVPSKYSGFYIQDPMYSNLIRYLLRKRFIIKGYDVTGGVNGLKREKEQAFKIINFLSKNPSTKIVVFCGYAHNDKSKVNKMMAYWLSDAGLSTYSIDQSTIESLNQDSIKFLLPSNEILDSIQSNLGYKKIVDAFIVYPRNGHPLANAKKNSTLYESYSIFNKKKLNYLVAIYDKSELLEAKKYNEYNLKPNCEVNPIELIEINTDTIFETFYIPKWVSNLTYVIIREGKVIKKHEEYFDIFKKD